MLVGRPECTRLLGRHTSRWEDNIKKNLNTVMCEGVDWIRLAQDRVENGNDPSSSL
jgi:hypothetical protein